MKKKLLVGALFLIFMTAIITSSYNVLAGQISPINTTQAPIIESTDYEIKTNVIETLEGIKAEEVEIDTVVEQTPIPNNLSEPSIEEPVDINKTEDNGNGFQKANGSGIPKNNQRNGTAVGSGNQYRYRGNNGNSQ